MGRELAIACIPCAKMTPERVKTLHQIVDDLVVSELELEDYGFEEQTEDESRKTLHGYVEMVGIAENRWRDVNHIWFSGFPYELLAAGGDAWHGEPPSELYHLFRVIGDCDPIWKQLEEWARADQRQPCAASKP